MSDKTLLHDRVVRAARRAVLALALVLALCATVVSVAGPLPAVGDWLAGVGGARVAWAAPSADDATTAAIQAVIQRANDAQEAAFAARNPAAMKDTATSAYYDEMAQTNADLARAGVTAIKLLRLEWGPVTLTDGATATATTYETWQTTYADGTTDVSRDPNVYTLVLDGGAWKIQTDEHGTTAPASGAQTPTAPAGQTPPATRVNPASADVSHNWSGYAATGGGFTSVTGTWTVPQSDGTVRFGSAATWVGIGGVTSADLVQAGTMETSLGNGSVQYQAWVETLPQASRRVAFTVSPGDSVTVSISEAQTAQWTIAFKNNTTGETYQTTVRYTSSHSSAEWVQEAPSTGRSIVPLDNFGAVAFTGGSAVKDGQTLTIAQAGGQPITMVNASNQALATPSALTTDGGGFTVTRTASATTTTTTPSLGRPSGQGGYRSRGGQPRSPLGGGSVSPFGG